MSDSWEKRVDRLEKSMLPEPEPDMTGWTSMERLTWEMKHHGVAEMLKRSADSDALPMSDEEWTARLAHDDAILAERAARTAEAARDYDPTSARAQQAARQARAKAGKAREEAFKWRRIADEAARNPRPKPVADKAPVEAESYSPAATDAPANAKASADAAPATGSSKPAEAEPPKQWWEERARWRMREPKDFYWARRGPNMCLHAYDVLDPDGPRKAGGYHCISKYDVLKR